MKYLSVSHIDKARRLKLSKWQLFWHYFLGLVPLPLSMNSFYRAYHMTDVGENFDGLKDDILLSGIFWLFLGLGVLVSKWYRLKFRQFDILLTQEDFKSKISQIPQGKKWTVISSTNDYAELNGGSHFTFGLKITIVRRDKYILVNSICDPDRPACISVLFENERNIAYLKKFMDS